MMQDNQSTQDLAIQKGFSDAARKNNTLQEVISGLELLKSNPATAGLLNYKIKSYKNSESTHVNVKLGSVKVATLGVSNKGHVACFRPGYLYSEKSFSGNPEQNALGAIQFIAEQASCNMPKAVVRQNSKIRNFFHLNR